MGGSRKSAPAAGAGSGGQVDTSNVGASRGKRGAEGAEGVGLEEGVSPSPMGSVLGRGPCPLPRKFLISNWRIFYGF